MKRKFNQSFVIVLLCAAVLAFMFATDPSKLPLPLLVVPFLLTMIAFYLAAKLLLRRYFTNLDAKTHSVVAMVLAGLPVLLIVLQSIGQLTGRDLLIVLGLAAGLVFYLRRADFL